VKIHIVQKGDTLWKIAKKYGVNFEELKKMNSQLSNPDMIMPGMKIKVPTSGGMIKKEAPIVGATPESAIQLGVKKEMPTYEHPFAKEQPKPLPVVEAPKKEMPIIKEAPKAPFVPKMPLQIVPEIDINNYYMMNMASMNIQQPQPQPQPQPKPKPLPQPKPVVLPEVKEVPKPEVPVEECPPLCVEQPCPDYCVPVTPVMPGPGCIPMGGYPIQQMMPYPTPPSGVMPISGVVAPSTGVAPTVAGASYMPPSLDDESSSFMPQMPMMNPGMGMQNPMTGTQPIQSQPIQTQPYMQQPNAPIEQMPMGYQTMPAGTNPAYGEMPTGYPGGQYPQMQAMNPEGMYPAYQNVPSSFQPTGVYQGYPTEMYPGYQPNPYYSTGYSQSPVLPGQGYVNPAMTSPYGQMPYGYPQMGTFPQGIGAELESPSSMLPQMGGQSYPVQGQMPVGTGTMGDCGCGAPQIPPQTFVPTTPPVYSAPYTAPMNVAQPPFMKPYGIGPMGAGSYAMPRYDDESNDY
jgi:morphogenetic protein associated with SpoVID